jgi:hypothetical protein
VTGAGRRLVRSWPRNPEISTGTRLAVLARGPRVQIAVAWGISRVLVFSAAAAILLVGAPRGSWRGPRFSSHPFALLERWDGRWCGMVAEHGYLFVPGRYSDAAFFPLLPLLLRVSTSSGSRIG